MEEVGNNVYECVIYKGFELAAQLWDGKPDNEPYRTNDLFFEDPPGSGFFTLQGRRDDILVHSNGENTSAGALQLDIQSSSKMINKVLALGYSKPNVGILVELSEGYNAEDSEAHDKIWDTIKQINLRYPSYSQVMKHMIYILPAGETLPITPKGNVRRKEAERIFASEIEQLYSDNISSSNHSPPSSASSLPDPLSEFLRHTLASLCSVPLLEIHDWTTFYDIGLNSNLALSLRSSLSSHLRRSISLSTIFENPTISNLVSILEPSTPLSIDYTDSKPTQNHTTQKIISNLNREIQSWPLCYSDAVYPPVEKHTILLTGSTGSLGTSLLEKLCESQKVEKIYALVRGPQKFERMGSSLQDRGINPSILLSGKVEVLNFCMQDPLLGLDIDAYAHLAKATTIVIQNAWKMDFNVPVEEFEPDCIRSKFIPI
jgi:hypothetical protein